MSTAKRAASTFAALLFAIAVALSAAHQSGTGQQTAAQRAVSEASAAQQATHDALLALAGDASPAHVSAVPENRGAYVPGQLIVGLAADTGNVQAEAPAPSNREQVGQAIESLGFAASPLAASALLVTVDSAHEAGDALSAAARDLAALPGVRYVQPNYRYASAGAKAADIARDEDVDLQWYLNSWEDSHGANIAEAWGLVNPQNQVDVAVLDTGLYVMPGAPADDPGNSHQEFGARNLNIAGGRDFVNLVQGSPQPLVNPQNASGDDNGHGTHIAAIIAADAATDAFPDNEPVGMAGVSPVARIVPLKVLDAAGEGNTAAFVAAYDYLLEQGRFPQLRVINMSLSLTIDDSGDAGSGDEAEDDEGTSTSDIEYENGDDTDPAKQIDIQFGKDDFENTALREAIDRAERQGVVTVCAAGNEASAEPTYPSDYPECVSVTALDADGANAGFSNLNQYKDISAPGVGIYSAWNSQADAYAAQDGTSQAAAIVSGVLSMVFSARPDITVDGAKEALYSSAHAVEGGAGQVGTQAYALAGGTAGAGAGSSAGALVAAGLQDVQNGSHGAVDAAAALKSAGAWAPTSIAGARIEFEEDWFPYTGSALKPEAYVSLGDTYLVEGEDYLVSYANNVNPGKGNVSVTGIGAYGGSAQASFQINLAPVKIKKLKKAKKSFTATWARQKLGGVGYQLRYSLKKNMKKAKTKTVKKNASTKLKVKKLKSKKRYYVQVRSFKKIGGKTYYSAWSAKKSVKLK